MLKAFEEIKIWHLVSGPVIGDNGLLHSHNIFSCYLHNLLYPILLDLLMMSIKFKAICFAHPWQ